MNEADAIELSQAAIWAVIVASGPAVSMAMIIGLAISLFQALTQIQEMTLTFIPKIVIIFLTLVFAAPFMGAIVYAFAELCYSRIETGF